MGQHYSVTAEDLSHLGGPMGTEYTTTILTATCASLEDAKEYAQRDYRARETNGGKLRKAVRPIPWVESEGAPGEYRVDLSYIGYTLRPIKIVGEGKTVERFAILDPDGRVHVFGPDETITAARQFTKGWRRQGSAAVLARVTITTQKVIK